MDLPFRALVLLPVPVSYVLAGHKPELLLSSQPGYIGTFFQLFFLELFVYVAWRTIIYPKYISPLRHLPSPKGGSWWNGQFARISAEPTGNPQTAWVHEIPNDGLIRYLGLLNEERILVTNAKTIGEVLTTKNYDFIKPQQVRRGLGRVLGIGVLLAEGEEHKFQRKNLMPAFAFRHVKNLYSVFWEKSREAVLAMTEDVQMQEAGKSSCADVDVTETAEKGVAYIEAQSWASRATLDIIGLAGMGKDFGSIKDPDNLLNRTYRTVFKPSKAAQILGLLNLFFPTWVVRRIPVKRNGEVEAAASVIRTICRQLIREKKEKLENNQLIDIDILSVALESGGFDEENLVDQLMTFLAAGHETTASGMTWAIYMMCLHPEVQTRLRQEIRERLPSIDEAAAVVNSQDIDHMPYLNAVCNEVMRYYAPVPLTLRQAAHDTTLGGQHIPKGTRIMLVPWATNKDEALWGPDARTFNPDRWLPKDGQSNSASGGATSNYAFLTFLHGPRSCIGQGFAKAEFACLLAAWVGRFEFELKDKELMDEKKMEIKGGVTARPVGGLVLKTKVVPGW